MFKKRQNLKGLTMNFVLGIINPISPGGADSAPLGDFP